MSHTYRADDPVSTRWLGKGSRLSNYEGDLNEYQQNTRLDVLEANYSATVSLANITQPNAYTLIFELTDATQLGPFTLPIAVFDDKQDWLPFTPYLVNDTFNAPDGGLYRVKYPHTSGASFDPAANDGMGHDFYASMIPPRGNVIPAGGAVAMYFRKNSATDYDANWAYVRASEVLFVASTVSALTSDNVADALEELEGLITGFDAFSLSYTPSPGIWLTSDNVGDALEELAGINAVYVVFAPPTDSALTSDNVADALVELEGLIAADFGLTAASTTEVLTGTDTAKYVTPDALAALWEKGSNVASASIVSLGEGGFFHITGTTTITDIDWATAKDGRPAIVVFDGILTLTHNATTLKLPGNANITTAAGDRAIFVQDASDNVICISYIKASGEAIVSTSGTLASTTEVLTGTDAAHTVTPDALAALWEKGSDVASAATISIGEGGYFHVTGTTTITDIDWGTAKDGRVAILVFDGALTLTHNGTTLKLPGSANITTAAGDRAIFVQDSGDNVICVAYFRASGEPLIPTTTGAPVTITVAASDESTALTTGTAKVTFRMPHAMTLTAIPRASLSTAQASGSVLTVDINEGGSSILSTKLTFDNTEKTTTTAGTPAVLSDTTLADDAEITIDIDQVGDGTAKGLKVTLIGTR